MVQEIALANLGARARALRGPQLELVVEAAVAGNSPAQLWQIGQAEGPALLVLWDQANNVLYLCGELIDEAAQRELTDLIQASIRPRSIQLGRRYFKSRIFIRVLVIFSPSGRKNDQHEEEKYHILVRNE